MSCNADVYRDGGRLRAACTGCGWNSPETHSRDVGGLLMARLMADAHNACAIFAQALAGKGRQ